MSISYCKKILITLGLFASFSIANQVSAETFRVHKTIEISIPEDGSSDTVKAGINDALSLELPKNRTFVQGVELSIKVPQIVASWHDSVAWSIYNGITPPPSEKSIDYTGTRITVGTFNSLSINIQIPLTESNSIKKTPYSHYVNIIPEIRDNKIFFRLQIAMKGVPEEIDSAMFEVTAKPILIEKGRLFLKTEPPKGKEDKPYTVFIDENPTELPKSGLMINAGVHIISIVSDFYRNELRTVTIEQAKDFVLNVSFRDITPTVLISAPSNAVIFLDDTEVKNIREPFNIQQGDHKVKFVIGDYEVVKTINAVNGRSYTVSLDIDAKVTESE